MESDGTTMRPDGTWYPPPTPVEQKVRELEERLAALEGRLPNSGVHSQGFWERAWTVFGYNVATSIALMLILLVLGLLAGATSF